MRTISIIHVDVLEKVYVLLISAKQPKHSPRSYNCGTLFFMIAQNMVDFAN